MCGPSQQSTLQHVRYFLISTFFSTHSLQKSYQSNTTSYRISSVIRRIVFYLQNNPENLDPSYKMDLDLWDCFGRVNLNFIAELHIRTDLVICSHSREGKPRLIAK